MRWDDWRSRHYVQFYIGRDTVLRSPKSHPDNLVEEEETKENGADKRNPNMEVSDDKEPVDGQPTKTEEESPPP